MSKGTVTMFLTEYQEQANRTAKELPWKEDLVHAALGIGSEAGEFLTDIKAHVIYGKPLNRENAVEELGDLMWFIARAATVLGEDLGYIGWRNIEKLKRRYPEKYSDKHALARADKQEQEQKGNQDE